MKTKTDILNMDSKMRELGYSSEEGCETPIILNKENIFVVKDCIDRNKELPCFKGIAFFDTRQINEPLLPFGDKFFVLNKKDRFVFIAGEKSSDIRDENEIIGHITYNGSFHNKSRKFFHIEFTPTQEAVVDLGLKTEEIHSIMEGFKKHFELKLNFTQALNKIKQFCCDKTLTDEKVKYLFNHLNISHYTTDVQLLELSKALKELRPNIIQIWK